ncbi:MAG: hypothetical protein ABI216_22345 [Devosia sp.]
MIRRATSPFGDTAWKNLAFVLHAGCRLSQRVCPVYCSGVETCHEVRADSVTPGSPRWTGRTGDGPQSRRGILRDKARGQRDFVTVIGHAATISAGEWITATGEWVNDRTHGHQFKARFMQTSAPTSIEGIEKYLGSGDDPGHRSCYAKKMVKLFSEKVFDIIEADPDRLREVDRRDPREGDTRANSRAWRGGLGGFLEGDLRGSLAGVGTSERSRSRR